MDINFDKRELKKLRKLGLNERQIAEEERRVLTEKILDKNCDIISKEVGKTIKFSETVNCKYKLYVMLDNGRCIELMASYKDVICDINSAISQIKHDLSTRLYYI